LVKNWEEFREVILLLEVRQKELLENELVEVLRPNKDCKVMVYEGLGLDGFSHMENPNPIESLDPNILYELMQAELVISDNCIWPLFYRPDTVLVGHFFWHDIFHFSKFKGNYSLGKFVKFERLLIEKARTVIGIENFVFGDFKNRAEGKSIFLPEYCGALPAKSKSNEIWYSVGSTGLNLSDMKSLVGESIQRRESFELTKASLHPKAIFGRPGLGTIRDCIEFDIPFFPVYTGYNEELKRNTYVLFEKARKTDRISVNGKEFETLLFKRKEFIKNTSWNNFSAMIHRG
jgi:hypothetical protein